RKAANESDRGLDERPIVVDVEAPDTQIAKPSCFGANGARREEIRKLPGDARLRRTSALLVPELVVEPILLRAPDGLCAGVDGAPASRRERLASGGSAIGVDPLPAQPDFARPPLQAAIADQYPLLVGRRRVLQRAEGHRFEGARAPGVGPTPGLALRVQVDRTIERHAVPVVDRHALDEVAVANRPAVGLGHHIGGLFAWSKCLDEKG